MSPSADSDTTSEQGQSPQVEKREQRDRRAWTEEEDAALIDAVRRLGSARGPGSAWTQISQADCRKRWFHSLDPSLRKGKWSADEDEALKRLYRQLGPQWKEIALHIPGRKDDQCSKRWRDVLDPILTPKKPWTPLEDALLLQLHEQHGAKWTTIADHLPGRSPLACRNRSRKYFKLSAGEPSDPNPSPQGGASSGISNPPVDSPRDDRRPSIANSSTTVPTSAHTLSGDHTEHAGLSTSAGPNVEGARVGSGGVGAANREGFQGWELAGGAHPFDLSSMLFNYPLQGSGAPVGGGASGRGADSSAASGRDTSKDRVRRAGGDGSSVGKRSGPGGMGASSEALESSWPSILEENSLPSIVNSQPGDTGHGQVDAGGDVAMDGGSGAATGHDPGTDFITHWLSSFPKSYFPTSSGPSPDTTHSSEKPSASAAATHNELPGNGVPITNVWGLLLALDSGQNAVHVDAQLLRQLLADASGGKNLTGMT